MKAIKILALIIFGGIGLVLFVLYATVKTKSTNLKNYEPYKELIGKTLVLQKETYLFKDETSMIPNGDFPYTLMDDLHPRWAYFQEGKEISEVDITEVLRFPKGVVFHIEKAIQYTNGVSGSSNPTLFGTIDYRGKTYKISYPWGERNIDKAFRNVPKCWQFHQAPWQDAADTTWYALPTATVW